MGDAREERNLPSPPTHPIGTKAMRLAKTLAATLLSTLTLASATAVASSLFILDERTTTTQASGSTGDLVNNRVGPDGGLNYQALYEISMWEDGDHPCKIQVKSRHLNTYEGKSATENECTSANDGTKKTISFTDSDTYIRGVQVCLNNSNDKIKGLKLYGTKLNRSTGRLENLSGSKSWERPNCNGNWKTVRYCDAGMVAVAVEAERDIYYKDFKGLRLQCKAVETK